MPQTLSSDMVALKSGGGTSQRFQENSDSAVAKSNKSNRGYIVRARWVTMQGSQRMKPM